MLGVARPPACSARTRDGSPCGATPMRDQPFCFWHHPDHKQEAAEARRLGGLRRRRERTLEGAYDLHKGFRSVDGILRFVEIAALDLLGLDASVARSNAMFRGACKRRSKNVPARRGKRWGLALEKWTTRRLPACSEELAGRYGGCTRWSCTRGCAGPAWWRG